MLAETIVIVIIIMVIINFFINFNYSMPYLHFLNFKFNEQHFNQYLTLNHLPISLVIIMV